MQFLSSHKRLTFILAPILILLIFSVIYGIHTISPTENESYRTHLLESMEQASSFSQFTNALFCYEVTSDSITTAYTLKDPSAYKIPELSPTITSFSYKGYNEGKEKQSESQLLTLLSDTLNRFDASDLDESEQITYSLLENQFNLNKELRKYAYYEDLLGATSGVQANLPVTLSEYPIRTETDVKIYLSLLTQIPGYFEDIIRYEKHRTSLNYTSPSFLLSETKDGLTSIIDSLKTENNCFADTFNERIQLIEGLSEKKIEQYKEQNLSYIQKYVLPAYKALEEYINVALSGVSGGDSSSTSDSTKINSSGTSKTDTSTAAETTTNENYIPDLNTPYGLSILPDGAAYYSLLAANNTGSDKSVEELIFITEQALKEALGDVLNIALSNQDAYLYYCENPMNTYYESPEAILESLSLMIREDYPILKDTPSYRIKSVPDSLAQSVSPAFYMIPAIDDYTNNTIYINSLYTNTENGNMFTTLAHEGFPGHLYQTVYFNAANPDAIRQILNYPGYVEGWATYVEINAFTFLDYPLEGDSLCRLYQDETIINLAISSRIDMGVNYQSWTLADVNNFFEKNGFNSYYAADIYSYVVEAPSVYLRYFIGYLEIMELKGAYKKLQMENYSEKDFHKKLLDIGPADFETLEKYLLNY